ncbi:tetratricopeptide repeat protein [Undibacterium sp. TS12]|uniref:tetratricopeptide repeat protein n=1 Tax=Undibacterium sp. TS12 TaxID=2908202 RepID=UPI001F4D226E|nr:tetratricopeptide repeat protein [Undibacterium sp. TS12]MCH8617578.1 tetratricopeptide repeat protein [Undibacterium sp. TS12]
MLKWLKNTFSKPREPAETSQAQLQESISTEGREPAPATQLAAQPAKVVENQMDNTPDVIAIAYQKLGIDPSENLAVNILADRLYDKNLLPEAEALYRLILKQQPDSLENWINLGLSLDGQSRFAESISCYQYVLNQKPDFTIACFNLAVSLSFLGKPQEAEKMYMRTLEIDPNMVHAHFNLGILFQQRDHFDGAIHHYQELLKIDPTHYFGYCNLGMIHARQNRLEEAEPCFLQAIAAQPSMANADFFLVQLYQQLGRHADAETQLKRLLQRQPENGNAREALLNLYTQQRRFAEAADIYRQMLEQMPNEAAIHYNIAVVLAEQGKMDEAMRYYQQALQLKPDFTEAHCNLGLLFQQQGKLQQAEASLQRSLDCNPCFTIALANLSHILSTSGRASKAEANYRKAIALEPQNSEHQNGLGRLLSQQARYQEAEACYQQALKLNPDSWTALHDYGRLHMLFSRLTAAQQCFEQAIRLKPDFADAYNSLGALFDDQGMVAEAVDAYRHALEFRPDFSEAYGNLLFALNYHADLSAEEIFAAYREYEQRYAAPLYQLQRPHTNQKQPDRRLKIGYVSPDLRRHPVQYFLEPLLAHHDKSQFEIHAYSELVTEDAVSARYRDYTDHWVPTAGLSDDAMAEKIRADGIDILVDLAGHTGNNRLRVFARKPAPVSLSWLGYGYTTGLEAIDYFLADHATAPSGTEALFAEQVWRIANPALVYRPTEGMGAVSSLPALGNGYITLGTLSRAVRINHKVIRTWAKILQRLDKARLVIDSANFKDEAMRKSFEDRFAALGIDKSRLQIGMHSPPWDVLRGMDIGLDCFPHNSGTTLFETLYMGVPFVTLAGRPGVGRLGSCILEGLGRPEWIAYSEDEYVDKVVQLASNPDYLNTIRLSQRAQMQGSKLMDETGFTHKLEAAYRAMWQNWCAKP